MIAKTASRRRVLAGMVGQTAASSPEELAAMTRADADKWGGIIKQLGLAPQ
jgi:hypothetical protein